MNHEPALHRYTQRELNRLHDEAHQRAPQLRREAINAFWDCVVDVLSARRLAAQRAAARFARRLEQHRRQRATGPAQTSSC
jgi:hypothetical protein